MTQQLTDAGRPSTTRRPRGMPELGLALLRPVASRYLRRTWDLHERGEHKVPTEGPVIFASNHIGWLDGPLLIVRAPRLAHALVKAEAFEGRTGLLLRLVGQIPVDRERQDTRAVRAAADALAAGQSVVVYPEGIRGDGTVSYVRPGVAWLALVSGAPVVPVALFGTREKGAGAETRAPKGSRLDIVYGDPIRFPAQSWPRTRERVGEVSDQIHAHLKAHVEWAARSGHLELPGPLPQESSHV